MSSHIIDECLKYYKIDDLDWDKIIKIISSVPEVEPENMKWYLWDQRFRDILYFAAIKKQSNVLLTFINDPISMDPDIVFIAATCSQCQYLTPTIENINWVKSIINIEGDDLLEQALETDGLGNFSDNNFCHLMNLMDAKISINKLISIQTKDMNTYGYNNDNINLIKNGINTIIKKEFINYY